MPQEQTERSADAAAMHRLLAGSWVAQIIYTAAELGLADHFGEEPQNVASLASATATHAPSLSRLLRALAGIGVVHETDDRRYSLTLLGATLRSDQPGSMRAGRASCWARNWGERGGHCRMRSAPATTPFATFSARISGIIDRRIRTSRRCATTRCKVSHRVSTPKSARITRLTISAGRRCARGL